MIVLDTNVLSEAMRPNPDPRLAAWFAAQPRSRLWAASITEAEILVGIALLPPGQHSDVLGAQAKAMFEVDLAGRVLPFGRDAAAECARLFAARRRGGRPIVPADATIAATALAAGATLFATRNTRDFEGLGLRLLDSWAGAAS